MRRRERDNLARVGLFALLALGLCLLLVCPTTAQARTFTQVTRVVGQVTLEIPEDVRDAGFVETVRFLEERLPIRSGDPWEPDLVQETIRSLHRRGLFAQIRAYTRNRDDAVDVRFRLVPVTTVSDIQFLGNVKLKSDDLRLAIHLRRGDAVFSENLDKARRRLLDYHRRNGFPAASVVIERQATVRSYENIVRFIIEEGEPLRIQEIRFIGDPFFSQHRLLSRFPVRVGQRVVLSDIEKAMRQLEDFYRREGFKEIRIALARGEDTGGAQSALFRRGVLRVDVKAGQRISLRFVGNQRFSPRELEAALRLDQERVMAYSWATLRKLAQNLVEFYQREGYLNVRITTGVERRSAREKQVTFLVQEGQRLKLKDVTFDGNAELSSKTLKRELFAFVRGRLLTDDDDALSPPKPGEFDFGARPSQEASRVHRVNWSKPAYTRPERLNADQVYIPDLFEEGARALEQFYRENGFLSATVSAPKLNRSPTGQRATVHYVVREGPRTSVRSIRVAGASEAYMDVVLKTSGLVVGTPLNDLAFPEIERAIRERYGADGYLYANVETAYVLTPSQRLADVTVTVYEGPQVRVGQILVSGLNKTKAIVVTQELSVKEGEIYKPQKMEDSQRWLQRLGIFQASTLKPWNPEKEEEIKDVLVTVTERKPGRFELSGGVATDDGIRARSSFVYRNLFGRALEFHLRAKANYRIPALLDSQFADLYSDLSFGEALEREVGVGLFYPSILGSHIGVRGELIHQREQERSYGMDKNAFVLGFGTEFLRYLTLSQINEFAYVDVVETYLPAVSDSERYRKPTSGTKWEYSPKLQGVFDYRDNIFDPTRGVTLSLLLEYYETISGTDNTDLFRTSGSINGYIPIPIMRRPWVLRLTLRSGYIHLVNGQETPVEKRFKLGGRSTIRGFGEESIHPAEEPGGAGTLPPSGGGDLMLLFRSDLRIPVYKSYQVGAFSDIGQLWLDPHNFNLRLGDYKKSAGAGMHYRTPVGDISLEVGWNLHPLERLHEEHWRLHFSISLY